MSDLLTLVAASGGSSRPSPQQQAPLPPLDTTGNPNTTLPAIQRALPSGANKRFWRENAWSLTLPGLPWLPGLTSSIQPERCLTWFLGHPLWADWVDKILTLACTRGYTHFTLSWPDCRQFMSQAAFVALAKRVKSWGFTVHIKWWSKDYDPLNSTWEEFGPMITPVLSALMDAGAMDACSPWEFNAGNVPGDQGNAILAGVSQLVMPAGVDPYVHFTTEYTAWQTPGTDRFTWWNVMIEFLIGLHYQADGGWDMGTRQARYRDTTNNDSFAAGKFPGVFVAWEGDGATQFDNPQPDESHSAMHGYLDCCTDGLVPVSGFGDGMWLPDGTPTLTP